MRFAGTIPAFREKKISRELTNQIGSIALVAAMSILTPAELDAACQQNVGLEA